VFNFNKITVTKFCIFEQNLLSSDLVLLAHYSDSLDVDFGEGYNLKINELISVLITLPCSKSIQLYFFLEKPVMVGWQI
jgi:hypothetical protein